jgi:hypothetical protein
MRDYYKYTKCYGFDDEWNVIPIDSTINKSYKTFKFKNSNSKDIGYQKLSDSELEELIEEDNNNIKNEGYIITRLQIYKKINNWITYIQDRGAILSYILNEEFIKALTLETQVDELEEQLNDIVLN